MHAAARVRRTRPWLLTAAATLLSACLLPLAAQETEGPLSPAGRLRLEVAPSFHSWDSRFAPEGGRGLGSDLADPSGARLFPGIATLENALRELLERPGYAAHLGRTSAYVSASRVRVPVRLDVGVRDWLTLGVTVPLVQSRTEAHLAFRADSAQANLGVSPTLTRAAEVIAFTDELSRAADAARARALEVCAQAPGSAECTAAERLGGTSASLLLGLRSAYAASPFFPISGSAEAAGLLERVEAFAGELEAAGLPELTRRPPFAAGRAGEADLESVFAHPLVGLGAPPLGVQGGLWELGDVEVQAALRLLEGALRDTPLSAPRLTYQLGGRLLVRLGTGSPADPDVFFSLPSGDGQTDLEAGLFGNVRAGRFGLWSDLRYGVQRPTTVVRRVGPPDLPLVAAENRATLEWSPGNYFELELAPRYHLTRELAFAGSYRLAASGEDAFTRVTPAPEPVDRAPLPSPPLYADPSLLAEGTARSSHELGAGLVFSTLPAWREGRAPLPFEARVGVRWAVAGSGRDAPDGVWTGVGLRLFRRLWGR